MGADQLKSLRYAGEGEGFTFGQAYLPNGPWPEIKKLYFDTAQASDPWNFGATRTFMPMTQLLLGSDYPFIQVSDTVNALLDLGMSEADLRAVTRDNALRLFPRLRTA